MWKTLEHVETEQDATKKLMVHEEIKEEKKQNKNKNS